MSKAPTLNQLIEARNREAYRRSVHERAQENLNKAQFQVEKAFGQWKSAAHRKAHLEREAARARPASLG